MSNSGAVAAGHPLTAQTAKDILDVGGNAYDAVIGAFLSACVCEPVLASLGGGGFMLAGPQGKVPVLYDFFVQTPKHKPDSGELDFHPIEADFGSTTQTFHIGMAAMATPGAIPGIFAIHKDLGQLPMADIAAPAMALARDGIELNAFQHHIFEVVEPIYTYRPDITRLYSHLGQGEQLASVGETLVNPDYADTLQHLIDEGEDWFRSGDGAQALLANSQGGLIQTEDLRDYQVIKRTPLACNFNDSQIVTNPLPSTGGSLISFGLQLLQSVEMSKPGGEASLKALIEAMGLTQDVRLQSPSLEGILEPQLLQTYRQMLSKRLLATRGTTHISVVDAKGNAAALTFSNGEGNGHVIPGTGIVMNNMLGEQDLNPAGFHQWPADKRMVSMMSPTIVDMGQGRRLITGSGGSNRIRTALLQVLMNVLAHDMDIEAAVQAPRVHFEDGFLHLEAGLDDTVLSHLLSQYPDHRVWPGQHLFFGGAHSLLVNPNGVEGCGDPRRGGVFLS